MVFVKFCENRYQELKLQTDSSNEYDALADAQIKALTALLHIYRITLKWVLVPKCLLDYFLVNLHLKDEPVAVIMEKMKADQLAKKVADQLLSEGKVSQINKDPSESKSQRTPETPSS